jgi:RNA polymerase sigma factor (sigma-70 family)
LLESFLACRDEAAFEALLKRHGSMVLGVCRRVLHNRHDAEDAFQAAFLVLVRKAASVRPRELVGNWLHGVAYRTAMNARRMNARRRRKEQEARCTDRPESSENGALDEMLERLDEALGRLPEKYRAPVVLCELEGRSRKEVARTLGLPEGTLSWRLAQAKKMLARKLARRGPALSAGGVTAVLSQGAASAALSASLLKSTTKAGLQLAAGQALVGTVPTKVIALTQGVLKAMLLTKLKVASWAVGVVLLAAAGAVGLSYQQAVAQTGPQPRRGYGAPQDPNVAPAPKVGRQAPDDLESLRLEIEALRRELRATKDMVKELQAEVRGQKAKPMQTGVWGQKAEAARREAEAANARFKLQAEEEARLRAKEAEGRAKLKAEEMARLRAKEAEERFMKRGKEAPDPLAELEDAVKRLRKDPTDKRAAEALDRALRRMKERPKPEVPGGPRKE